MSKKVKQEGRGSRSNAGEKRTGALPSIACYASDPNR
jgi:hypothetical protein